MREQYRSLHALLGHHLLLGRSHSHLLLGHLHLVGSHVLLGPFHLFHRLHHLSHSLRSVQLMSLPFRGKLLELLLAVLLPTDIGRK